MHKNQPSNFSISIVHGLFCLVIKHKISMHIFNSLLDTKNGIAENKQQISSEFLTHHFLNFLFVVSM